MRGAQESDHLCQYRWGIIPADAGSTWLINGHVNTPKDHPRGCGEHLYLNADTRNPIGSSPRMRGALTSFPNSKIVVGIIPADAGSTSDPGDQGATGWDHPRGCGEHSLARLSQSFRRGSSPRMRGALCIVSDRQNRSRIIPADAGSTICISPHIMATTDHPRGCGEHSF